MKSIWLLKVAEGLKKKGRFQLASQAKNLAIRVQKLAETKLHVDRDQWELSKIRLEDDIEEFAPKAKKAMREVPKRVRMSPEERKIRQAERARLKRKLEKERGLSGSKWDDVQSEKLLDLIERSLPKKKATRKSWPK